MSSTFGGIELGKRSLQTQQKSLDVTGHNISNANNENYSRQRAIQTATDPYAYPGIDGNTEAGQVGTGVKVEEIERMRDEYIDHRIRYENHSLGEWSAKKENLKEVESIFNDLDSSGYTKTLNEFWSSFQDLNNEPESMSVRESVVQKAVTLTSHMEQIDKGMMANLDHLGEEIKGKVDRVNDLTSKIADLNDQIKKIESDLNKNANDLMDKRDALTDELSELVDIKVRNNKHNQANISVNGINLVDAQYAKEISVNREDYKPTVDVDTDDDLADDDTFEYDFDKYSLETEGNEIPVGSGEIKGLMDVRDKIMDYKMNNVDEMARRIKNEVNNLHTSGTDMNGDSGEDFFEFVPGGEADSSHFAVNENIQDDPSMIAASGNSDIGDGSIALEIADLKDKTGTVGSTTFNNFWESSASELGIEISRAERMEQNQKVVVDELKQKREEISGVSLDEEMSNMVKYQHGYNAAAKVISTMDEMLDTLVNGVKR